MKLAYIVQGVLLLAGLAGMCWYGSWQLAASMFIFVWGNTLQHLLQKH